MKEPFVNLHVQIELHCKIFISFFEKHQFCADVDLQIISFSSIIYVGRVHLIDIVSWPCITIFRHRMNYGKSVISLLKLITIVHAVNINLLYVCVSSFRGFKL